LVQIFPDGESDVYRRDVEGVYKADDIRCVSAGEGGGGRRRYSAVDAKANDRSQRGLPRRRHESECGEKQLGSWRIPDDWIVDEEVEREDGAAKRPS
jgi:hypothetical protein